MWCLEGCAGAGTPSSGALRGQRARPGGSLAALGTEHRAGPALPWHCQLGECHVRLPGACPVPSSRLSGGPVHLSLSIQSGIRALPWPLVLQGAWLRAHGPLRWIKASCDFCRGVVWGILCSFPPPIRASMEKHCSRPMHLQGKGGWGRASFPSWIFS